MEGRRDRTKDIERGMKIIANLPDIMPDQADERIKPVYESIQQTLRVPIVNLIFRTLANYPDYFLHLWEQLSLKLRTKAFEQAADNIRNEALLKPVPDVSEVNWENIHDINKLRSFNDTIHYVLPKLLILTTAFEESTFGLDAASGSSNQIKNASEEIPLGAAKGTTKVKMIDPDKASDRVQDLFESIKESHGHPLVSSYFRGLGNWPDFLEETWNRLQPIVGTSVYEERKHKLIARAELASQQLSFPKLKTTMLNEEQSSEVHAIIAAFRLKFIPEMLLDVALIKAMLDGSEAASSSPFSATGAVSEQ